MEEREELDFCLVKKRTSYFSKVMQSSKPAKEKSGVRKLEIKFMFLKKQYLSRTISFKLLMTFMLILHFHFQPKQRGKAGQKTKLKRSLNFQTDTVIVCSSGFSFITTWGIRASKTDGSEGKMLKGKPEQPVINLVSSLFDLLLDKALSKCVWPFPN